MVEIRFFVPGTASKNKGSDAGSDADIENDDDEEISAAQAFHDAIKEKAELGQVTGDMILRFEEVLIVTPRGRYDVDMFPDFLRLRGKTYDYKIAYPSIQTLFLLPKDEMHILFVVRRLIHTFDLHCSKCHSSVSARPFVKVKHATNTSSCSSTGRKRQRQN